VNGPAGEGTGMGSMDTAVCGDRSRELFNGHAVTERESPGHGASLGKPEFFGADMYMFHVTGFRPGHGVLTEPLRPGRGARLDVWTTDPADRRPVPVPGGGGVLFSTEAFALKNSGNRTLRAPKSSWRIILDATGRDNRLAGMTRINLKAMYNDPSQMREALAWRLFGLANIPAPRHTYAKLAFGPKYRGLFSVIEHVDKKFLRDHSVRTSGETSTRPVIAILAARI
jgi:CotH kinase protein